MIEDVFTGRAIAIVGTARRFPGARDTSEIWTPLRSCRDALEALIGSALRADGVPKDFLVDPAFVEKPRNLPDIEQLDAQLFHQSCDRAARVDPQRRLLRAIAWAALEYGGYCTDDLDGSVAVCAGSGTPHDLIQVFGERWTEGAAIDWRAMHEGSARRRILLLACRFQRSRYWLEDRPPVGSGVRAQVEFSSRNLDSAIVLAADAPIGPATASVDAAVVDAALCAASAPEDALLSTWLRLR